MSFFPTAQPQGHLVQFNAGKCIRQANKLVPDVRKGTIYMDQSDDQLMHFYWKERKSSTPEEDLIIFPEEAELVKVEECTTGRVYLLKFRSSDQKLFFWMQDKNEDKDKALVERVNQLINDPQSYMDSAGDLGFGGESPSDLLQILGDGHDINMTQENLLQFLQSAGTLGGRLSSPLQASGLPGVLSGLRRENGTLSDANLVELRRVMEQTREAEGEPQALRLTTSDAVSPESLFPLLKYDAMRLALFPFVRQSPSSTEEVRQISQSTDFYHALYTLNAALANGDLDHLSTQLEADDHNIESFLRALERQARRQEEDDAMDENE
ncbi:proteasome complex subunit Rpn13 ubiquitin receptor-domain-containing protein [Phycomyces nitens]|nr:proteasome complex subunit Rpn13 ubiquitin receptor-domain-containing protein [Phycomyces nitens]